jgi:Leucine-rich repeat (LRR) protein
MKLNLSIKQFVNLKMKWFRVVAIAILTNCLIVSLATAQEPNWVKIPDANLVLALQDIVPAAIIGDQLNTESPVVTGTFSLDVGGHGITNLYGIQFFTSLTYLECKNNGLASLPELPATLLELYCNSNQLTSLPKLPTSLEVLDCSSNELTSLPVLPSSLKNLTCFRNKIAVLPELPKTITELIIYSNKLTCLPVLSTNITTIDISKNQLACVPNYLPAMGNDTTKYQICGESNNKNGCPTVKGKKK